MGSGVYTVQVTPTVSGPVTVDMAATAADDLAGNASLVATQFSIAYDNTGPTPVITSTASPGPTNGATIPISIDFGETVTDFSTAR